MYVRCCAVVREASWSVRIRSGVFWERNDISDDEDVVFAAEVAG